MCCLPYRGGKEEEEKIKKALAENEKNKGLDNKKKEPEKK